MQRRAKECTGAELAPERRSSSQQRALRNILGVTHAVESDFLRAAYRRAGNSARLAQFFDDGTGHLAGPNDHVPAASAQDICSGILPEYQPKSHWTLIPPEGRADALELPAASPRTTTP